MSPIRTKAYHFAVGAVLAGFTALTVRAESLKERLHMCFDCHGENGQSQRPEVPSLGAQQAMYSLIEWPESFKLRVKPFELNAGFCGCELPIGFGVTRVAIFLPCGDFAGQGLLVGHAAIQALG